MHKQRAVLALILSMVLATGGCARSKPTSVPTPAALEQAAAPAATTGESIPREIEYRLAEPASANHEEVREPVFTILVENCAGEAPLERVHSESRAPQPDVVLDTSALEPWLANQQTAMEQAVREGYGLVEQGPAVENTVPVSAPPRVQVEYQMRWEAVQDVNVLEALENDQVIARVPVRVTESARLVPLYTALKPCPGDNQVSVPMVVAEEGSSSEAQQTEGTLPPPGSDLAMGLVQDYLTALDEGDLEKAYGLLHQVYQERVPFESYQKGYATLEALEVHGIEVLQLSPYLEQAEALVTLVMEVQGKESYSDWLMTLDVSITRGKPPYQRSISAVRMQELAVQ